MLSAEENATPYDKTWTWLASSLVGFSILTWLGLTTGSLNLFPDPNAVVEDDRMATIAYWGLLVGSAGIAALGTLATIFAGTGYTVTGFAWPRFSLLEDDRRVALVARLSLAVILLIPISMVVKSGDIYFEKSMVTCWDAKNPISRDFVSSRIASFGAECSGRQAFRLASPSREGEANAHQWSPVGDAAIVAFLVGAIAAWVAFFRRAKQVGRATT